MKEALINTELTRRHFHKLLTILEECREEAAKSVEYYKEKDDNEYHKEKLVEAMNRVRDLDMIIEALCEED